MLEDKRTRRYQFSFAALFPVLQIDKFKLEIAADGQLNKRSMYRRRQTPGMEKQKGGIGIRYHSCDNPLLIRSITVLSVCPSFPAFNAAITLFEQHDSQSWITRTTA